MQVSKKLLVAAPVLILILFLFTGMAYAEGTKSGVIAGDSVNVRSKPDTSAKVVSQLSDGTEVSVTDSEGDWYKISFSDSTGWIFKQFITVRDEAIASGVINGNSVNIRSKPDISSEILTNLDDGKKVDVYEKSGNWYRIGIGDDRYGWVNKEYIAVRDSSTTASRGLDSDVRPPVDPADVENSDSGTATGNDDSTVTGDEGSASGGSGDEAATQDDQSDLRQQIVAYAKKFLGVRYVYGGSSPKGFDCSGFTSYVFKHFGIELERTADDQGHNGTKIDRSELKPGDLVFFDTNGGHNAIEHVGIYIGDGQFIQASSGRTSHRVVISDLTSGFYDNTYMRSRRYISD